jgi:hypothetical protein
MDLVFTWQLQAIIEKVETIGCKVFKIPILTQASGLTCVKFLIPDFEQFHLIQTGKRILPNKCGMRVLEEGGIDCYLEIPGSIDHEKKYGTIESPS